ncbi:thiamine pyrophosphate-binding protein [Paucibacter sp. PLA-PC-4]|uniref:thiamine pyrophosphate-binding protein n=1 Tax=Paucibacter sp. PLA-PC-4 TaxID=2993655 RepID=UPI00224B8C1C|nr:thiamine pyrophosphate-binding protein [Paucibacter sp. PLA-PC-4]MCX2863704.1 thiamine pyrophosphate-binding protein [Paucibacter sp. PLA-PC-4]
MLGAALVAKALKRQGVSTIFSLSGNQIMPIYDACIDARIRIVHVRHEAAAVFMADAWAQVTGEIGVALLTAGPGVSNGIAPLFSARLSESPVLLLSGDSPLNEDGMGSFQEMDQVTMSRPLTKLSERVRVIEALAPAVDRAIATALAPRQGPVHLALPFDLLTAESGLDELPAMIEPAAHSPLPSAALAEIAALLGSASKPLILVGPADCRAHRQTALKQCSDALQVPIIPMESPRGLRDPSLGAVAACIAEADVVVLLGKQIDFTLGFARSAFAAGARVAVIDPEAQALDRATRLLGPKLSVRCQADTAEALASLCATDRGHKPDRAGWSTQVAAARAERGLATPEPSSAISSPALCQAVQTQIDASENTILVCDGGEFGQWAQAFCSAPIRLINGMSGAIGGGICYAIAAKIARPDAQVVLLMGDGTAGFHFTEFDTAVREGAAFTAIIGNDLRWNAEHVIQMRTYGADRLIGCSLSETARYDRAAAALGGYGASVDRADQLVPALRAAMASGRPACLNVQIDGQPAPVFTGKAVAATH